MLRDVQIQVGCLLIWVGFIVGGGLIAVDAFTGWGLSRFGLALLIAVSTYSVRRKLEVHDRELWAAFDRGRAASDRAPDIHALR